MDRSELSHRCDVKFRLVFSLPKHTHAHSYQRLTLPKYISVPATRVPRAARQQFGARDARYPRGVGEITFFAPPTKFQVLCACGEFGSKHFAADNFDLSVFVRASTVPRAKCLRPFPQDSAT